jgi:hypothetical protein
MKEGAGCKVEGGYYMSFPVGKKKSCGCRCFQLSSNMQICYIGLLMTRPILCRQEVTAFSLIITLLPPVVAVRFRLCDLPEYS